MTSNRLLYLPRALLSVSFALAASAPCFSNDGPQPTPHNLVLFVPEVLPAAGVDSTTAPTLARLRAEGVNFVNSHSGFPRLNSSQATPMTADFNADSLVAAATSYASGGAAPYSAALIDESQSGADSAATNLNSWLKVLLPQFKQANRPFLLIYRMSERRDTWEDDPESTAAPPPPWLENVHAADAVLVAIEEALKEFDLTDSTNVVVAAEHGVARIWKASGTSPSLKVASPTRPEGELPPGFLAIDLISVLQESDPRLSLFDVDNGMKRLDWEIGETPERGNAVIAADPSDPDVLIEAYGGHDALYLPQRISKEAAKRLGALVVDALFSHDYVSGVFVNEDRVGRIAGALSMKHIAGNQLNAGRTPDIVVGFASATIGCDRPTVCTALIADTPLEEGGTIPGNFNRSATWTFMAARGPDFQSGYVNRTPASNADIGATIATLLQIEPRNVKRPGGRVLTESLRGNEGKPDPLVREYVVNSKPAPEDELVTQVRLQAVGSTVYFDAAGFPGWTVGLKEMPASLRPADRIGLTCSAPSGDSQFRSRQTDRSMHPQGRQRIGTTTGNSDSKLVSASGSTGFTT